MKKSHVKLHATIIVISLVLWLIFSFFISQLIIGLPMVWLLGKENFHSTFWTTIYTLLFYALFLFLVLYIPPKVIKKLKADRIELGLKDLPTWTDIGLAPVGFIVYILIAWLLTILMSNFPWFDAVEKQELIFNNYYTVPDRILTFISLVVIAPIAEEIAFRGWLYGKLRAVIPKKWSIVISALIVSAVFGALHGQLNVAINVGAMSLVLCAMREITGTVYSGIIFHMLKNAIAFYLLIVTGI